MEDCTTKMVVEGGSSQSKSLKSGPGHGVDLVRVAIVDRPTEHLQSSSHSERFNSVCCSSLSTLRFFPSLFL